jgi:hypothetical protein
MDALRLYDGPSRAEIALPFAVPRSVPPRLPAPDVDLADPAYNKSGVPWHDLYYQGNYPRLQQIKSKWDPRNVFHHKLSIEPQ